MAFVSEHMARDLVTVAPDDLLGGAAVRMAERRVGAALILDGERLVGILSERDILRAVAAGGAEHAPVSAWMTPNPETIEPDDSLDHAAVLMIHGGFRHLPVVDSGRAVGILSIRDLVRVALDDRAPRGA
jgi:CBS domain-containing protein